MAQLQISNQFLRVLEIEFKKTKEWHRNRAPELKQNNLFYEKRKR